MGLPSWTGGVLFLNGHSGLSWRDAETFIPESDEYARQLCLSEPFMEHTFSESIELLNLPNGSRGLDVGCGIGLQAVRLAEAIGPSGHVCGLDISSDFIAYACRIAEGSFMSERTSFIQGSADELPYGDDEFDWAWSSHCVGYGSPDPLTSLGEMSRVVKPGGIVALLAWSSQQLLPGYPMLEARLNATSTGVAPFSQEKQPQLHFMRALGWFRELMFHETRAHTILTEMQAPLDDEIRLALSLLFDMRWGGAGSEVQESDWAEFQRLCLPESPDFILDLPDYYGFFTITLFYGRVSERS